MEVVGSATLSQSALKTRRPWLAALLSLVTSGLGQLYNRQPRRATVVFLVEFTLFLIVIFTPPPTFASFMALFTLAMVWKLGVVIDAFVQARKRKAVTLAAYNRSFVYVAIVLCAVLLSAALSPFLQIESFAVASESGFPTLRQGERVMTYSIAPEELARGDMVILRLPRDPRISYVRRIVGLPGERVRMLQGHVLINNMPLHRTVVDSDRSPSAIAGDTFVEATPEGKGYLVLNQGPDRPLDTVQEQRVPEGHYWVLGDNRDDSIDSRAMFQVGFVPAQNIYRKVAYIYWSRDLSRIGKTVE
jgi:signal peptidase I